MSIPALHHPIIIPKLTIDNFFSLQISHTQHFTSIMMILFSPQFVTTKNFPRTFALLNNLFPSVLRTRCFNEQHLPFDKEVKETEIAHLFEHIMLEYLCIFKLKSGYKDVRFHGVTDWDWHTEPIGTFHIKINSGYKNSIIFSQALQQSVQLMKVILSSNYLKSESFKQSPIIFNSASSEV